MLLAPLNSKGQDMLFVTHRTNNYVFLRWDTFFLALNARTVKCEERFEMS